MEYSTASGSESTQKWPQLSLREAGIDLIDCDHRTPSVCEAGFPYVAIPQLKEGHLDLADARLISADDFEDWTRKAKPQAHDVVLSRRCNPGETAYVPEGKTFAVGQNLVLLRSKGTKVYPPFLRWLTRGPEWWDQIEKYLNYGAVFDSLKCADVPNFTLTIPPLPEQRCIAHILGTLDDTIELNRRMNATLEGMARALFRSWFVDFDPVRAKAEGRRPAGMDAATAALFPDGFAESELGEIPKGWKLATLKDGAVVYDARRIPLSSLERAQRKGQYPYYGAASIVDYVDDYLFEGVHILVGEDGTVVNAEGSPVVQYVWGKFWVNNHAHILKGKDPISTEQLLIFLKASDVSPLITGAVQPKITQENLLSLPFILPDREISFRFSEIIRPLCDRIRVNADGARSLSALRNALLPRVLSGDLPVHSLHPKEMVA
ncbi:MAG: restriction endonuclease subunit S [Methanoregulaceae archaeon]